MNYKTTAQFVLATAAGALLSFSGFGQKKDKTVDYVAGAQIFAKPTNSGGFYKLSRLVVDTDKNGKADSTEIKQASRGYHAFFTYGPDACVINEVVTSDSTAHFELHQFVDGEYGKDQCYVSKTHDKKDVDKLVRQFGEACMYAPAPQIFKRFADFYRDNWSDKEFLKAFDIKQRGPSQ